MANRVFNETQTYRGTWVAYLIILVELPTLILLSALFFQAEDKTEMGFALGSVILAMGGVFLLVFSIQLETRIDNNGVSFKYLPFIRKWRRWTPDQIKSIEVISYSPITDYGGWGLKGNSTTKAYSVIGDKGILMDVGEKKRIMIGTERAKELTQFIEEWKEVINNGS